MVEWYEAYADYDDEAGRLEALVRQAAAAVDYAGELDLSRPVAARHLRRGHRREDRHRRSARIATSSGSRARDRRGWTSTFRSRGDTWFQLADELLSKFVEPTCTSRRSC